MDVSSSRYNLNLSNQLHIGQPLGKLKSPVEKNGVKCEDQLTSVKEAILAQQQHTDELVRHQSMLPEINSKTHDVELDIENNFKIKSKCAGIAHTQSNYFSKSSELPNVKYPPMYREVDYCKWFVN